MRQAVTYALYVWLALSFIAIVVRQFTKPRGMSKAAEGTPVLSGTDNVAALLAEETHAAALVGAETNTAMAPAPAAAGATPVSMTKETTDPDTLKVPVPTVTPVSRTDIAPPPVELQRSSPVSQAPMAAMETAPTETAPTETAPTDIAAMGGAARDTSPPTSDLAKLLAGIRLPHDLLPVVPSGREPSDQHVSLMTSVAPADIVGPAVADELERLGYQLEPANESQLLGRRGDDILTVSIIISPATTESGGVQVYPAAKDQDVVVTIDAGVPPTTSVGLL